MSPTTARQPRSATRSSRRASVRASVRAFGVDWRPLAVPAFRRMWAASVICAVGGSFSVVAVPTQLFTVTGSSSAVGTAAGLSFATLVVAAVWSGARADVKDRRTILLAAHLGLALTYTALWLQAVLGGRSVPVLLVAVAFQGLTYGTVLTTTGATVPRLVPAELLPAANSLSSLVRYGGSVLGPMLAGVLVPVVGLGTLYLFDAVALLAVVWAVAMLPPLPPPPATGTQDTANAAGTGGNGGNGGNGGRPSEGSVAGKGAPAGAEHAANAANAAGRMLAGFRYLAADRLLVAVLAVDLAAMVFGMPSALFPELARDVFGGAAGGGPETGLLYAAYPAGVVVAGLLSGTFTRARRHGALVAGAAVVWGLAVVLVGLAAELWIAVSALALGGAVNCVLSAFRTTITQARTDDAVRGRVQGALTIVLNGGPQIANLLHGFASARVHDLAGGHLHDPTSAHLDDLTTTHLHDPTSAHLHDLTSVHLHDLTSVHLHDAAAGVLDGPRLVICAGGLLTVITAAAIAWAVPELRRYSASAPATAPAPAPEPEPGGPARRATPEKSPERGVGHPERRTDASPAAGAGPGISTRPK
ncbi:MFS transporter [Microbispora hainanensis]|uniref:MFS transporter n=1 Tax=Microbispora hainanensis TaxID=568844 RepID=UPI002E2B3A01|nr:MFS transporter [Microbispora hainanensis]